MIFNSKKFKELRRVKNLSVQEVADKLNVTKVTVYSWQSKGNVPEPNLLSKLAAILDVEAEKLVINESDNSKIKVSEMYNVWKDETVKHLKDENERLWLLVQKLTGAQVADLGKLVASTFVTKEFPFRTSVTKQVA